MSFDFEKAQEAFGASKEKIDEDIEGQRDLLLDYQLAMALELEAKGVLERAGDPFLALQDMEDHLPIIWYSRSINAYGISIETYGLTYRRIDSEEEVSDVPIIVAERYAEGGDLEVLGNFIVTDGELLAEAVNMLLAGQNAGILSRLGLHCDQIKGRYQNH